MVRYTKEIFDILSKGGFISQNSISQQRTHLYDAIEDDFQKYQEYYQGIGFLLERQWILLFLANRKQGGTVRKSAKAGIMD